MNGNVKLLVKNSLLLSIAPFLPKVINVLLLPIMTKYLSDVDFGISGTISSYTSSITAFSTLGLTVILQNTFFKTPLEYKGIWKQIYGFLSLWMIVYAFILGIILYLFIPEEAADNKWLIIFLSISCTALFGPTGTIGSSYYIYSKQSVPVVWRSVLASVITILVDFVFIVYLRKGYLGWYIGSFAGTFFSNASYWLVVNRKLELSPCYRFKWSVIKHALKVGVPTIPHYYTAYLLEGSGRMVLDQYNVSQGEIGKVSIAQQVGDILQQGMAGLNNAVSPYIMQALKANNERRIKQIALIFSSGLFMLAFVLAIWSKEIFDLLLSNDSLKSAYPFFILYVMALCYRPMYLMVSTYYFYYERTPQLLCITFLSGCIALVFYIVFTPIFGPWAFLLGHYAACLYYGYSGYFYSGYRKNSKERIPCLLFLIAQLILTVVAWFLVELLIPKIVITIVLSAACIVVFLKFRYVFA